MPLWWLRRFSSRLQLHKKPHKTACTHKSLFSPLLLRTNARFVQQSPPNGLQGIIKAASVPKTRFCSVLSRKKRSIRLLNKQRIALPWFLRICSAAMSPPKKPLLQISCLYFRFRPFGVMHLCAAKSGVSRLAEAAQSLTATWVFGFPANWGSHRISMNHAAERLPIGVLAVWAWNARAPGTLA